MNEIFRALGRALVSQFHPRMLWLAIWPFLVALVLWGVLGFVFHSAVVDWLASVAGASILGSWIEAGFRWFGFDGGLAFVASLIYLGVVFALMILTALLIIATVAMPSVVAHVSERDYPTLARKNGGSYLASIGNALWVSSFSRPAF